MLQYMLDTDICIFVLRNRPPELRERFNQLAETLCLSTIALGELLFGAERSARPSENRLAVEALAARVEVLPFSAAAAAHFGQLRAELTALGAVCGAYDMLIAAHARSDGLTVVTNNLLEFGRVPGLRVENWV